MAKNCLFIAILLLFTGCVAESSFVDTGITSVVVNKQHHYENIRHNKWTYSKMMEHYFWNEDIPDSTLLDFCIDPYSFFYELLSSKDRFSWCELNTKAFNPGSTVSFDSVYLYKGKKVGYAIYDQFDDNSDIRGLVVRMKNAQIDEMILDLRYNPGGYVSTCSELASFIVPQEYLGKLYQQQYYNKTITREKAKNNNNGVDSVYFNSTEWYNKWNLGLDRLIVLTTEYTASASESLIICLRPYIDVIIVGTQTRGKNVGSYTISSEDYKYCLQPITFKYFNALMQTVPDDGFMPDIMVDDDKRKPRGDIEEALLKAALQYINDNS